MNKIEKEYEVHTLPDDIKEGLLDGTYLELNIEDIQADLAKTSKRIYMDLVKNNITGKFKKVLGMVFRKEDLEYTLDKDADYIVELLTHIADTGELLEEIKQAITEENYLSLAKLTDFLVNKYIENFNYLQGQRTSLEHSLKGISFTDNKNDDTREETKEFVRRKLAEYRSGKHLEKKD